MIKKIVVVVAFVLLLGFSFTLISKTENTQPDTPQEAVEAETTQFVLPDKTFSFSTAELNEECSSDDAQLCTVETAVKCTLHPDLSICAKADLPKFIFMRDTSLDRPTEMNYKIIDKKLLSNEMVEIYTESNCNGGWFGLCQGTIIYVLAPKPENSWFVKEIYAIE